MDRDHSLEMFRSMLYDCYNLWNWKLDSGLNVIETNSPGKNLQKRLLLSPDRISAVREHMQNSNRPLILGDVLGLMWAVLFLTGEQEPVTQNVYVLGPVYIGEMTEQMKERLSESLNLTLNSRKKLNRCLRQIPTISMGTFFQHIMMFHYYIWGEVINADDFVYYTSHTSKKKNYQDGEKEVHAPYITEKTLIDMVRTGNMEYSKILAFAGAVSPGIRLKNIEPVQQAKYSLVAFITLCTRAAIEGGLPADCAYTLSDVYTEKTDGCRTLSEITAVSHAMYEDFISRVNKCRHSGNVLRPVQACCDYIDTHPMENISVGDLAERAGYTAYYFSRMFKKETGQTIKEYICSARIQHSKLFLDNTDFSIQEISAQLHFCSQSYFAEQFKKREGILPSDYRMRKNKT